MAIEVTMEDLIRNLPEKQKQALIAQIEKQEKEKKRNTMLLAVAIGLAIAYLIWR